VSKKLFKNLKAALEDVAAHQRGELELYSETITIPEPPADKLSLFFLEQPVISDCKMVRIVTECNQ
jgi:hypothetical protein